MINIADNFGNKITTENGIVKLKLKSERFFRRLGEIIKQSTNYLFLAHRSDDHIFRKANAFGLNHDLIKALPDGSDIVITTETRDFFISKSKVLQLVESGNLFLWFKTQGFERQIFIPLSEFEIKLKAKQ